MLRFAKAVRRRVAAAMLLALVVVQLATAAYACAAPFANLAQDASMAAMEGCTESGSGPAGMVDPDQPGLCLEHCKGTVARASEPAGNSLGAASAPLLAYVVPLLVAIPQRRRIAFRPAPPRYPGSPPLSILHCCYRI